MFVLGTRLFTPLLCFINQLIVQLLLILILSNILCGVRQGCSISIFLFLLVTELLSLNIVQNQELKGIYVLGGKMRFNNCQTTPHCLDSRHAPDVRHIFQFKRNIS